MDLEERLVRLPRTGEFGWLRDYGDPVVPVLQAIRRRGPGAARRGALRPDLGVGAALPPPGGNVGVAAARELGRHASPGRQCRYGS